MNVNTAVTNIFDLDTPGQQTAQHHCSLGRSASWEEAINKYNISVIQKWVLPTYGYGIRTVVGHSISVNVW